MTGTVSRHVRRKRGAARREPQLILALECEHPLTPPARFPLGQLNMVTIGRGDVRAVEPADKGRLTLRVADGWMSSEHARLVLVGGQWLLEDLGSKNGTLLAGATVDRHPLGDGDVFELGQTFFVFREAPAGTEDAQAAHPYMESISSALAAKFARVARIADSDVSVVLRGESGTGKELMARAVHELSGRKGRFVPVNCGALVENLVQSELFGYRRGAFSGATEDRLGLIRSADGGTLFLDEVGDMPPSSQAVLLRVLQEREVKPLGTSEPTPVDLRLISATHRDLAAMIDAGQFRADLYARLSGFEFSLPPLRQRLDDLGLLIGRLLTRHARDAADDVLLTPEAGRVLFGYDWPLNVRELEQCVARALVLAGGEPISPDHLPDALGGVRSQRFTDQDAQPAELSAEDAALRDTLAAALERHTGNVSAVARELDKDRKQIHRWIRRFAIDLSRFR